MGSGQPDSDVNMELDDSGCVEDESPPMKQAAEENGYVGQANLLDLSDDVLLYILRYCAPHDLKALGFSCPRLGSLVLERSLWTSVDARDAYCGRVRALWLMDYALHGGTRELKLIGFAKRDEGCQGYVNQTRKQATEEKKRSGGGGGDGDDCGDHSGSGDNLLSEQEPEEPGQQRRRMFMSDGDAARLYMNPLHHLPRLSSSPCWPDSDSEDSETECEPSGRCEGPVFTLGRRMLKRLRAQCPLLTTLYLEYCNINCNKIPLSEFPPTLKWLSLRGSRCYNLPLEKSYLFKIHDYLPKLEYLELSNCAWLEPASLLPLSKLPALQVLRARRCPAMQEFVAYISLATRYGFSRLEVLDFRGSPVGDSEVAALGWLPELRELYLSAPPPARRTPPPAAAHRHYRGPVRRRALHAANWEIQVPDYYATIRCQDNLATGELEANTSQEFDTEITQEYDSEPIPEFAPNTTQGSGANTTEELEASTSRKSAANICTQESADVSVNLQANPPNISEDADRDEDGERKRKTENGLEEAGPSKRAKEASIDETIASMQSSKTSVTKSNGFVTFRRTIFNNVTDINRRLNSESDDDSDKRQESPTKDSKEQEKLSPITEHSGRPGSCTLSSRVRVDVNDGASTSNLSTQFRVNDRSEERDESLNKSDGRLGDIAEDADTMDAENSEPPPKKIRLEADVQYQDKLENMSTSSCDGHFECMDVNIAENSEELHTPLGSNTEGHSSPASSDVDRSGPNVSGTTPSRSNNQENSTVTGQSGKSLLSRVSSSIASRLSRLRRSVGLEASPTAPAANQRYTGASPRPYQLGSSLKRTSVVGSGCSRSPNQVGSSPSNESNRSRIPAPSMEGPSRQPADQNPPQYIRFRRNQEPVIIQCPARQEEQAEPRHHVLYVNLGQQLHAVYRLLPSRPMFQSRSRSMSTERLDSSALVTDVSIRRFGRADGEDVNIVNIGPNGPQFIGRDTSGRPNRSNLRVLSATGYRNITDRSLVHLATAAPYLQYIDFSETGVTENGVEHFRGIRPDCQVDFSEFKELSDDE